MQKFQFYDYYTNKRISSNSGLNEIHSKLNAELGFSCEFCLMLLLTCRIKSSDAPGRPVSHMDSLTIDKADKWTNFTEIKSGFCVSARRTITRGSKATGSAEEGFERERENEDWGKEAVWCVTALSLILPDGWLIICGKCCGNSQMFFEFKQTGIVVWIPNCTCFLFPGSWIWLLLTK